MEHSIRIRVEGFEQQKLLSECIRRGIPVKDIHTVSDIEMSLTVMEWDYQEFLRITKNRYRLTVIKESGYKPAAKKVFSKKSTIIGLILFALIMFYQSTFVSEIQITGYEKFTEAQIRDSLRAAGLYEGCSKSVDLAKVKRHIYQDLDNIAWVGVKYIGNLAEVSIVEGSITPKPVDKSKPCDIVADKEGYIEKTIPKDGVATVLPGTYVKPGDILIAGTIPLHSTAYGTPSVDITERYVHAYGEVYAKVPYRLVYHQERYDYIKEPTGRSISGIHLEIGGFKINTARVFYDYMNSVYEERPLFHTVRPIPMTLGIVRISEVNVTKQERSRDELTKDANRLARQAIKEKVPETAQILNKSLKFSPEENIIGVTIMLEALEKIGVEKEIVLGNPTDRGTEDKDRS
ncbi:MAG TPA: sporulation protein YqfD [Bacillota bacterium]|nr:sporulation protein YqfD [Bacillota bacterium]